MKMRKRIAFNQFVIGDWQRGPVTRFAVGLFVSYAFALLTSTVLFPATTNANSPEDYSKFSHKSYSHSQKACTSCHQRVDNSVIPRWPGHKACTDCHLAQFVTPTLPMCAICHSSLSTGNPPVSAFPSKFNDGFNVKFDHAQHNRGDAKPSSGCAECHKNVLRRGVAMTIPAGLSSHNICYQCHTPGKTSGGRDISTCGACHSASGYRRTSTNSIAFGVSFSHAEHGPKQRLSCEECHSLREGLPQTQQVSSPRATQHFPIGRQLSCASCHNNKRAFGEADFDDCARCHSGTTFKFRSD